MAGLMQSWFVPHGKPPKPKINISTGGAGGGAAAGAPSGVAPGTSPDEFQRNQQAYYQQMLAGLGNTQAGNELPQGIQENIDRQASLIGS